MIDKDRINIVVIDENTFGYVAKIHEGMVTVTVLAVSVLNHGDPQDIDKQKIVSLSRVRLADPSDFERFRVSEKGYREKPEEYNYNRREFIDLGLPSGKKWAAANEEGYFTFDGAVKEFGKALPSIEDYDELLSNCKSEWDNARKGRVFTGPNGQSIFLPALGYRDKSGTSVGLWGSCGYYWSSSVGGGSSAYYLYFYGDGADADDYSSRFFGFSVRLIQE